MSESSKINSIEGNYSFKFYEYWGLMEHIFTVCLAFNKENDLVSRGISIKSFEDNFNRADGRNRSKGRAKKALIKSLSSDEIRIPERLDGTVLRKFKAKNSTLLEQFYNEIANRIGGEKNFIRNDDGKFPVFIYKIPLSYPLTVANSFFKFKSEYKPVMIEMERDLFVL